MPIGFKQVKAILDQAVGGPSAPAGPHDAFWRVDTVSEFIDYDTGFPGAGGKVVVSGHPESSPLIKALKGEEPFDGSRYRRMPGGQPPVSDEEIQLISDWIAAGCPEQGDVFPEPPSDPPVDPPQQPDNAYLAHPVRPSSLGGPRKVYRIHPSVGIARVGDSEEAWFLGPEVPGEDFVPAPDGKYRDAKGKIKRQGCRFRIYEYSYHSPGDARNPSVREITGEEAEITWHVHLANNKAYTRSPELGDKLSLPMDPGGKTVSGPDQSLDVYFQRFRFPLKMGTLKTDSEGRLIVLGGHGLADSSTEIPEDSLFWPDWCDDVADGPVRATIKLKDGSCPAVQSAWVVTGVPAFAAPIHNVVTLFDLAHDIAVRHLGYPAPGEVSFTHHIYPILRRAVRLKWVSASARSGHGEGKRGDFLDPETLELLANNDTTPGSKARRAREAFFSRLTPPGDIYAADMPALNFLTLTALQYELFRKWASGDFLGGVPGELKTPEFDKLSPLQQAQALDAASLSAACGGGFLPGVEVSHEVNNPAFWERPFRINTDLAPGALTRALSVPWQVDFSTCGWGWWPAARPNVTTMDGKDWNYWVRLKQGEHLLTEWSKQGFLANRTVDGKDVVVETERLAD